MTWLLIAAVIVVALLSWNLYRRFGSDRIQHFIDQRRQSARFVGRGEFVDGSRHMQVALAVTQSTFYYENSDMQASIDLQWVEEIEYATELATGGAIAGGKVLRLRSHSQTFEFVLPNEEVHRWHMVMPARRVPETGAPVLTGNLAAGVV